MTKTNKEIVLDPSLAALDKIDTAAVDRYRNYFKHIEATTLEDQFRRWLFAYASVHTTWRMNCKIYDTLRDLSWLGNPELLRSKLIAVGAGMHNNRTKYLMDFSSFYWQHPGWFSKSKYENWKQYRARIQDAALGLGFAKSAFTVEMLYLNDAEVICTDTHMLQLYGCKPSAGVSHKVLTTIEDHWVDNCKQRNLPPAISRWIYWDTKQGHRNCRYWASVFETGESYDRLVQAAGIA